MPSVPTWLPGGPDGEAGGAHRRRHLEMSDRQSPRPVHAWAVYAQEGEADATGHLPLEWLLLTTVPTSSFEQAVERLRWGIEVYHRMLKSGCRLEDRQLGQAARLETCLDIDMVVAWRIFWLVKQGREMPQVPCTVFFKEEEWQTLGAVVSQDPPPDTPPTLREAGPHDGEARRLPRAQDRW